MNPVSIRKANKTDKHIIANAMVNASGGLCDYILSAPPFTLPPKMLIAFEIAKDNAILSYQHCLIAEIAHTAVGVLCAYNTNDFIVSLQIAPPSKKMNMMQAFHDVLPTNALYIDTLYINPNFRGQGIGKYLLSAIQQFLLKDYRPLVCLYVWADNSAALQLYQKFGFFIAEAVTINNPEFPFQQARLLMVANAEKWIS